VFIERFLRDRRGVCLTPAERSRLEGGISDVRTISPRTTLVRAGVRLSQSTLLVEGIMCRYTDDREGLRQLVAIHLRAISSIFMATPSRCWITTSQR
jgi:hypothetical protein